MIVSVASAVGGGGGLLRWGRRPVAGDVSGTTAEGVGRRTHLFRDCSVILARAVSTGRTHSSSGGESYLLTQLFDLGCAVSQGGRMEVLQWGRNLVCHGLDLGLKVLESRSGERGGEGEANITSDAFCGLLGGGVRDALVAEGRGRNAPARGVFGVQTWRWMDIAEEVRLDIGDEVTIE